MGGRSQVPTVALVCSTGGLDAVSRVIGPLPAVRPSADLLLTTLALAFGPWAVAVVLSGYGNDGATGASMVHRCGGLVIASDEATSEVFAMPSAAINRDKIVDHVLAVDDIPAVLLSHVQAMTASS